MYNRRSSAAIDRLAMACARALSAAQPRCDETIGQLPTVSAILATDTFPIFRNGSTYATPVPESVAVALGQLPTVPAALATDAFPVVRNSSAYLAPVSQSVAATIPATADLSGLGIFNVMAYGAIGNGSSDDSAAILKAVAAATAYGVGASLVFPGGRTFMFNQTVNGPISMTMDLGSVRGFNGMGSIQFTGTTGDCIQMNAGYGQEVVDLYLYAPTASSGYVVNFVKGGPLRLDRVIIYTNWSGIGLTEVAGAHDDIQLSNFAVYNTNQSGGTYIGLDIQTANSMIKASNFMLQGGSPSTMCFGVRFPTSVYQDTTQFTNFSINNYGICMEFPPTGAGTGSADCQFENGILDQSGFCGVRFNASLGGEIARIKFQDCWIQAGNQPNAICVQFTSATQGNDFQFHNCRIIGGIGSNVTGINLGEFSDRVLFSNCLIQGMSGTAINIQADPALYMNDCQIINSLVGLFVGITCTAKKRIINCDFSQGNTTASTFAVGPGSQGPSMVIRDCPGITPYGVLGPPTLPATGVALANPYPFDMDVFVTGGTVSQIAINGVGTNLISGVFHVKVGDTITFTYTAAPTMVWVAR